MSTGEEPKGLSESKSSLFNNQVKTENCLSTRINGIEKHYYKFCFKFSWFGTRAM